MSPNSTTPKFSPPIPSQTANDAESTNVGAEDDSDLVRQLQEKDRRIQYLELKIQQLSQVVSYFDESQFVDEGLVSPYHVRALIDKISYEQC